MSQRYEKTKEAEARTERQHRADGGESQLRPGKKEAGTMRIAVNPSRGPKAMF